MIIALWVILGTSLAFFLLTILFGAPYLPTHSISLKEAFTKLYKITDKDILVDIGSGDGKVLRLAAQLGAKQAIGYEINPILVLISRLLSRNQPNIRIHLKNFLTTNLPKDTTVVFVFGIDRLMPKVLRKVQSLANNQNRPITLISYSFQLPNQSSTKRLGACYLYKVSPKKPDSTKNRPKS